MNPRKILALAGVLALCALVLTAGLAQAAQPRQLEPGVRDPILEPPARPDLVLTATAAPGLRFVGSSITYTLVVRNDGDASASNASVTTTLPAGLTLVSAKVGTTVQRDCSTAPTIACAFGTLGSGQSGRATVVAKATASGALTSRFLARTSGVDTNLSNNRDEVTVSILSRPLRPPFDTRPPVADPTADPGQADPTPPGGGTTPSLPSTSPRLLRLRPASRSILPSSRSPARARGRSRSAKRRPRRRPEGRRRPRRRSGSSRSARAPGARSPARTARIACAEHPPGT